MSVCSRALPMQFAALLLGSLFVRFGHMSTGDMRIVVVVVAAAGAAGSLQLLC